MSSKKAFIREIRVISGKSSLSFLLFLFIIILPPLNSFDIYNSSLQEEEILDLISYNKDNPLNLNTVSFDQLVKIPYIDFSTAERIIQRVEIKGKFDNINQLKHEKIIEDDIYDLISECFYISIKSSEKTESHKVIGKKTFFQEGTKINYTSRFKRKLQKSRAYKESIYLGSDNYMSNKITFRTEDIKFSFLSKKDAGEIGNTNNMKYSLSYSFYKSNSFILGSFKLKSPSRLSWDETSFRDDFILQNRSNTNNGISKKYISSGISSMDSYGLKGGAISYELNNSSIFKQQIEFYYGIKDITVNLSDDIQDDKKIKTVITTGFNRTINEIERYNNAEYYNQGFVYQVKNNKKFYLATSLYYQKYNYEFIDTIDERKYNNSFVGDVSGEYSFTDKRDKINFNFAGNNNSNYSYNLVFSHNFGGNTAKGSRSLSSVHLKFQEQNTNKYNPFSVSNMLNSSYEKDEIERSFSFLFKGKSSDRKIYFEIQNDFYLGKAKIISAIEELTGNKFQIQIEADLDKNNILKFTTSLKNEEELSTTTRKYIDNSEKKYELKHKFNYNIKNKTSKIGNKSFNLISILQYKDEFDGFGYLISENINFTITPNRSSFFGYIKDSKYKFRIGADSYYTQGNTLIYKNYFTTGVYTTLNSYSGKGISIYFIASYSFLEYYKITIGVNENYKNYDDTSGSGYDEIESSKVNNFEVSFSYKY